MTIEEIFKKHPTTLSYEEDARYVYPERQTLLIAEIDRLKTELSAKDKEIEELRQELHEVIYFRTY
ncbi:MAG: hypothetical protein WCY36_08090 [Candidatus Omnitrophota bacterium]